ncbi:MAG: carbohydrate kinase family protein [Clostridia bacterium]|nr:carbohydrate kinase family protein [Clostridia bacterium]
MNKTIDLIGFGDPYLDLVVKLNRLPQTNKNTTINDYGFQGGGNVPTACVAAARLGLKTSLIGCVGNDLFGKISLSDLEYNNVNISKMSVQNEKKSNFCICVTEDEVNGKEFISKPGDFSPITEQEIDEEFFASTRMMHVALITPAVAKACDIVHKHGGKISVDANYYRAYTYDYYDKIDIFIGSELYYDSFCQDKGLDRNEYAKNMLLLKSFGPEIVIFTFGPEGCRGIYEDKYFEIPAFDVEVVDTTGAGDVFHGAFDYGYLQGWDVEKCAVFSSAVSAIKCTRPGGRSGIPTLDVVTKYLETGIIDYSEIDKRVKHYESGILI